MPDNKRDSKISPPPQRDAQGFARQLANVMDLPFVLVGSVVIGAGVGYVLDKRFGTSPLLTLLLGLLGFAGGMLQVIRRLSIGRPTGKKDGR